MKHVIVITTVDEPQGTPITPKLQKVLETAVNIGITEAHGPCYVESIFNQDSAVKAVRDMFANGEGEVQP